MATLKTYVTDIELEHSSPIPLYHQISEPIKELILDGTIPPGAKLEDELSMASRLGVSRPTARRALQSTPDKSPPPRLFPMKRSRPAKRLQRIYALKKDKQLSKLCACALPMASH